MYHIFGIFLHYLTVINATLWKRVSRNYDIKIKNSRDFLSPLSLSKIEIETRVRRRDSIHSEKALNKRNDVLIGSFIVTCTPIVRRWRSICIGHLTGVHNTSTPSASADCPVSPPFAVSIYLTLHGRISSSLFFCFPACFFSPCISRLLPLSPFSSAFSPLQGYLPFVPCFVSLSLDNTLPHSLRPLHKPALERAFPSWRRRQREKRVVEPRTGASMAEARGQGERTSSPTLTSNKGGELMRERALGRTLVATAQSRLSNRGTAEPWKTLEFNPPLAFLVDQGKKFLRAHGEFFEKRYNESPTRVRSRGSYEVPRDPRSHFCACFWNFKENYSPTYATGRILKLLKRSVHAMCQKGCIGISVILQRMKLQSNGCFGTSDYCNQIFFSSATKNIKLRVWTRNLFDHSKCGTW